MNSENEKNKSGIPEPATTANSHYYFEGHDKLHTSPLHLLDAISTLAC
jgi:hypothetical protein